MGVCDFTKPIYAATEKGGCDLARSTEDGYAIQIFWDEAFVSVLNYDLGYNIYYSTIREDVFTEGVKLVSIDGETDGCVRELIPGDISFFAVKATQHDPAWFNFALLPDGFPGFKVYPEGLLLSDISDSDLVVPISDIDQFPAFGVILIGTELVRYTSKDIPSSSVIVSERGFLGSNIRFHNTDGYDGVEVRDPIIRFWKGFEDDNERVQQETLSFAFPAFAFTDADGYAIKNDVLTTDLGASDTNSENFPRYDFVGWHRTDPSRLLRGECIGTYYGGEQFCADGYNGIGLQLRGVPINQQAARREEVLLNTWGEPVVLVRRLWTGIRCSCVLQTTEQPEHRCPRCFPGGTLVRTELGWRAIENIQVGERVLSADGQYRKVTETFARYYEGDLIGIKTSITANPIFATPEHPLLTMRGKHNVNRGCGPKCNEFIKCGDGKNKPYDVQPLPSGNWHARITHNGKRKAIGSYSSKKEAIDIIKKFREEKVESGHVLKWDYAENISEKDWLVAKWDSEFIDLDEIEIPQQYRKNTKLGMTRNGPNKFVVDDDFLWMIGLYIAEGSSNKRTVAFALHADEKAYQDRIISFFNKNGYSTAIRKHSENGIVVEVYSTSLAQWLPNWVGKYCYEKQIPEELMRLPQNKLKSILSGIYDGDGTKSCHEIGQTSEILALQLVELLHKVGEQPLIRLYQSNILTPIGNKRRPCYVVGWAEDTATHINRKGRWVFKNEILTKVTAINKSTHSGLVYNLEVEDNHTYVVQGVVVHNCFGTGFNTGYQQFFNSRRSDGRIPVRFGPTQEDFKFEPAGLENVFISDCWTMVFPSIRDRDFIIRFDENGAEEFRYEILHVTRNVLTDGQSGAQKFSAQRVRKSDPIYMWRAIRNTATMPSTITSSIGLLAGPNGTFIPHTHDIVINEGIVALSQVNQTTSVAEGHNHTVVDGIVREELGHSHSLILP